MPAGAQLWYDDRDIPFLRDDAKDVAEIAATQAQTIKALQEAGWDPDTVIKAVTSGDFDQLIGQHTGLMSVQLRPQGTEDVASPDAQLAAGTAKDAVPAANGKQPAALAAP